MFFLWILWFPVVPLVPVVSLLLSSLDSCGSSAFLGSYGFLPSLVPVGYSTSSNFLGSSGYSGVPFGHLVPVVP